MFDKIKEVLEEEKTKLLKELKGINERINELSIEIDQLETELEIKQQQLGTFVDIVKVRSLFSRIQRLKKRRKELVVRAEKLREEIRILEKDIKSIEIVEKEKEKANIRKTIAVENLNLSYMHLIKKKLLILVLLFLASFSTFAQSATQLRVEKDVKENVEEDLKELVNLIEKKIEELKAEREKLKKLRMSERKSDEIVEEEKKLREKREKEIKKLVKAVERADADEIAPAIESLPPELAAEVLLRLKEKKAGEILASMNPSKASQIIEIILKKNPNFKISTEENW